MERTLLLLTLLALLAAPACAQRAPDYSNTPIDRLFDGHFWPAVDLPNMFNTPGRTPAPWFTCPNGTHYAVDRSRGAVAVPHDSAPLLHHRILGCIPEGHHACIPPRSPRIVGSCPVGLSCAYQPRRAGDGQPLFMGCVDDYARDCHGLLCPDGYTCCPARDRARAFCVPHAGDASDLEAVCGRMRSYYSHHADKQLQQRLPKRVAFLPRGQPFQNGGYYVQAQGFNMTADLTLSPPQYRDNRGNRCHLDDLMALFDYPIAVNTTTNATEVAVYGRDCCPPGTEHCYGVRVDAPADKVEQGQQLFVGCADPGLNELCCGFSICAAGHKCCTFPTAVNGTEPASFASRETICCPLGLQCCFGNPSVVAALGDYPAPANADVDTRARAYCGMPINGLDCAMDAMAPAFSYLLTARRDGAAGPLPL